MLIGISPQQFSVADALALYLLRKYENYELIEFNENVQVTLSIRNGNLHASNSDVSHYKEKLETAEKALNNDILRSQQKLTSAGMVYALYCVKDLQSKIKGKFAKRTVDQVAHDISHLYEGTVEVVDLVYWESVLPYMNVELKYVTPQKEYFLSQVREIAKVLKENVKTGDFIACVEMAIDSIGQEFEYVLTWLFDEWISITNYFFIAMCSRKSVHDSGMILPLLVSIKRTDWTYFLFDEFLKKSSVQSKFQGSILKAPIFIHLTENNKAKLICFTHTIVAESEKRFLLPSEWTIEGSDLSQIISVPGIISVAHSRDYAITNSFESAYNLAIKALKNV
ncbi:hypothetical protein Ddc_11698 [Ditylenchus destructor]|nr:hypothetical protein Ddc_11698 [Ditylenchus destructor]